MIFKYDPEYDDAEKHPDWVKDRETIRRLKRELEEYKRGVLVEFIGEIQHFYERGDDLIVLPKGRSSGEDMFPYGEKVSVVVKAINNETN